METNMITDSGPPLLKTSRAGRPYPDPETKLGQAWALLWSALNEARPLEYVQGMEVAARIAPMVGLQEVTVTNLFTRATAAGVLEATHRVVEGKRGPRPRGFYRIKQ